MPPVPLTASGCTDASSNNPGCLVAFTSRCVASRKHTVAFYAQAVDLVASACCRTNCGVSSREGMGADSRAITRTLHLFENRVDKSNKSCQCIVWHYEPVQQGCSQHSLICCRDEQLHVQIWQVTCVACSNISASGLMVADALSLCCSIWMWAATGSQAPLTFCWGMFCF